MPDWQSCANRHLLAHILKQGGRKVYYVYPGETVRSATTRPHPLTIELARILRSHAHCWALDMAEWPHPPTAQEQREAWCKAMELADRECRAAREGKNSCDPLPINPLSELL